MKRFYSSLPAKIPPRIVTAVRVLMFGSVIALGGSVLTLPAMAQDKSRPITTLVSSAELQQQFEQAIADDLAGRPADARKIYDTLAGSVIRNQIAVPSAINLAALGKFDDAYRAFEKLTASLDTYEHDYACLWTLWLTARTAKDPSAKLNNSLSRMAGVIKLSAPWHQAIVNLYAGTGSVEAVFAAVAAMPGNDEQQRRNALTEATFFAGGYLQYVKHNGNAALQLYQREQNHLNSTSLELPLIEKATTTLLAVKH